MRTYIIILVCLLSRFSLSSGSPCMIAGDSRKIGHPPQEDVLVAAAADLKFAMDSLIVEFNRQEPGIHIKVVYGSSGTFFEQIVNGAPFDLFFSADMEYPSKLHLQNKTLTDVKQYATGHIVLWSNKLDPSKEKMNSLLLPSVVKVAMANPAHAPYGKRAEESLRYYKLYDRIKDKLVIGENISQTAQFAKSGAADMGMIALSLALSPMMQEGGGRYWVIPEEAHQPLRQGFVLLVHAKENAGAQKLAGFVTSGTAVSILRHYGFDQPY